MTDSLDSNIFLSGELLLPTSPPVAELPAADAAGGTDFFGIGIVLLCIIVTILSYRCIFGCMGQIVRCISRTKACFDLEGSLHMSTDRNVTAIVLLLPFCLVLDRLGLYAPRFMGAAPEHIHLLLTLLAVLAFVALRFTLFCLLYPAESHEAYEVSHKTAWSFFIILTLLLCTTAATLLLLGTDKLTVKHILLTETGFVLLLMLIRRGHILKQSCKPFVVFLYLCALELLPLAAFAASALFL